MEKLPKDEFDALTSGVVLNKKFTQNVWLLKDDTDMFRIITDEDFHNNYEVMGGE